MHHDPLLDELAAAYREHEDAYAALDALFEESSASDGRVESPGASRGRRAGAAHWIRAGLAAVNDRTC